MDKVSDPFNPNTLQLTFRSKEAHQLLTPINLTKPETK